MQRDSCENFRAKTLLLEIDSNPHVRSGLARASDFKRGKAALDEEENELTKLGNSSSLSDDRTNLFKLHLTQVPLVAPAPVNY